MKKVKEKFHPDVPPFEHPEFFDVFSISCKYPKLIRQVFNAEIINHVLRINKISLEIKSDFMLISFDGRINPKHLINRLKQIVALKKCFPDGFLVNDSDFIYQEPEQLFCYTCGQELEYSEENDGWYCYQCELYQY